MSEGALCAVAGPAGEDERPVDVTVISSVLDEEDNLVPLVERVMSVMSRYPGVEAWEYLLVDDASTDRSGAILDVLQARYPDRVRVFHHACRLGQKGCFMTGFTKARGRISILVDADLQVLPEELPRLLDVVLTGNVEMGCTYNDVRRGGKRRHPVSYLGNLVMKVLFFSPVRNAGANFLAVETRFVRGVRLVANDQRYLVPITMRRGLRHIAEVGCVFRRRAAGRSKYSYVRKLLSGVPEMLALKWRLMRGCYDQPPVELPRPVGEPIWTAVHRVGASTLAPRGSGPRDQEAAWVARDGTRVVAGAGWRRDPWDSKILGVSVGRITTAWSDGNRDQQRGRMTSLLAPLMADARAAGVALMSVRLPEAQVGLVHAVQAAGFRAIESYLTFRWTARPLLPLDPRIRAARPDDVEAVEDLASQALQDYRYLSDPRIPCARARETRRAWVREAFGGRAHGIYVSEDARGLAGFVLVRRTLASDEQTVGIVDLLAVSSARRGLGLGRALLEQALRHSIEQLGTTTIEIGTQAKNLPAVNLYIGAGFCLARSELSLHWVAEHAWRPRPSDGGGRAETEELAAPAARGRDGAP